jgi:Na+-driven multidrug efflux pump
VSGWQLVALGFVGGAVATMLAGTVAFAVFAYRAWERS